MKGLLILNGEKTCPLPSSSDYDFVVVADGGYDKAQKQLERIDLLVGDMDSIEIVPENNVEIIKLIPEKDYTDGEIAIIKMFEKGVNDLDIYWAMGGRCDHFMGNLALLGRCLENNCKARLVSELEIIEIACGDFEIHDVLGKTISLFPFSDKLHILTSQGLKYPTEDLVLTPNVAMGISNVACEDDVYIKTVCGNYFVIINKWGLQFENSMC